MAYKFSKGSQVIGDLRAADDTQRDTKIDFGEDQIDLHTSGTVRMNISNDGVYIPDTAADFSLKVSGAVEITPGTNAGITFKKTESEINFIRFANSDDGTSFNGHLAYQAAEHLYISPGRGADFYIQARKTGASDPITFPFRVMDDGTARFEKNQSDSAASSTDIASDVAFYVSGTTDGDNNALFEGNVVMSGGLNVHGEIEVAQKIIHAGDADTLMRFDDNQIVLKAGNISMVKMEKNSSAPHEVTINDGSNNIDFVVKGNGSNEGNPGMKFDASTNKLGINGVGTPDHELHVRGAIKNTGAVYRKTRVVTSFPYTVADDDYVILVGGTGTPRRLDLPAKANHEGRILIVKDSVGNASSNNIELNPNGSETIEGQQDKAFNSNRGSVTVLCADDGWHIISEYSG